MPVTIHQRDNVVIFKLSGRIIGSDVKELKSAIDEQLANISESPKLLFDFAKVSAMDSSALGSIMGTHVAIGKNGGRIGVINVGASTKNLIIRSRLITALENFKSEDEAVAALTTKGD